MQTNSVHAAAVVAAPFSLHDSERAVAPCVREVPYIVGSDTAMSSLLIALCTCDWDEFIANKVKLSGYQIDDVCREAKRLLEKNSRSFRLLSIVSQPAFLANWDCAETSYQIELYIAVAQDSINKSTKESAFHKAAKAIRKDCLARQNAMTPTKLRLRNCHQAIADFMFKFASWSDSNRAVVVTALLEGEATGCGHLPSQQAVCLIKKLTKA